MLARCFQGCVQICPTHTRWSCRNQRTWKRQQGPGRAGPDAHARNSSRNRRLSMGQKGYQRIGDTDCPRPVTPDRSEAQGQDMQPVGGHTGGKHDAVMVIHAYEGSHRPRGVSDRGRPPSGGNTVLCEGSKAVVKIKNRYGNTRDHTMAKNDQCTQ